MNSVITIHTTVLDKIAALYCLLMFVPFAFTAIVGMFTGTFYAFSKDSFITFIFLGGFVSAIYLALRMFGL
jgi:hypothetical protein